MEISKLEMFDLTYPGHWIGGADRDQSFDISNMLSLVESEFIDAVASYSMFEPVTINNIDYMRNKSSYSRSLNTIYAKAFVYSLDSISKILKVLSNQADLPDIVPNLIARYDAIFGNLKHIRDSVAHIEDRGRALNKNGKKIPATIIVLGAITERRFEFTASDGKCYAIDISEATLLSAHEIIQSIINAFNWE